MKTTGRVLGAAAVGALMIGVLAPATHAAPPTVKSQRVDLKYGYVQTGEFTTVQDATIPQAARIIKEVSEPGTCNYSTGYLAGEIRQDLKVMGYPQIILCEVIVGNDL